MDKPVSVIAFKPADREFFYAQWTCRETGRKRTQSTKAKNRRDAERYAERLERQLNAGEDIAARRMPWKEFREKVEAVMLADKRPATRVSYIETLKAVETHCSPLLVSGITTEALDRLVKAVRAGGASQATVAKHLRTLKAILRWGYRRKYLPKLPTFDMPQGTRTAGGRAISDAEFDKLIAAVPSVVGDRAAGWEHLLRGLWASGLRLGEACLLTWDVPGTPRVLMDLDKPMLVIPGEHQKAKRDTRTPVVPEFLALLNQTPAAERKGFVFNPQNGIGRANRVSVQTTIRRIGKASGIRTRDDRESYVSAHDLRRSFCHRWSRLVLPQILRVLARHADVSTTLRYYADSDSDLTFDAVWQAVGGVASKTANTSRKQAKPTGQKKRKPR